MFMRNVGVLSLLVYDMLCNTKHAIQSMQYKALRTQSFFYFIFSAERAYTPVIFGCAFCRLMQSP